MIFLSGQHEGVCNKTVLFVTSLTLKGLGQGVTVNCTYIEIQSATKVDLECLTVDHWYISCPHSPVLAFMMTTVVLRNMSKIHIQHASHQSENSFRLMDCVFMNSSLSGVLYFIKTKQNTAAMSLLSSTLYIRPNASITFIQNRMLYGALYLNSSTLNIEGNVNMTFLNNTRAMAMVNSKLNAGFKSQMNFSSNWVGNGFGGAMLLINSEMYVTANEMHFINNSAGTGGALAIQSSTVDISNNGKVTFTDNLSFQAAAVAMVSSSTFNVRDGASISFINNSATVQGGAFSMQDSTINIENSAFMIFVSNVANSGGAMVVMSSILNVKHNSSIVFVNNLAVRQIGALSVDTSQLTFQNRVDLKFLNNIANVTGGMAVTSSTMNVTYNVNFTFINNIGYELEGAFRTRFSTVNLGEGVKMTFINNSGFATGAFGLMSSTLNLRQDTNLTFINNYAFIEGGAIVIHSSQIVVVDATNVTLQFISNYAQRGGAVALLSSKIEFVSGYSSITFINNSATGFGGAIYVDPDLLQQQYRYLLNTHCLYVKPPFSGKTSHNFHFMNNSAGVAGYDVYGATLTWCEGSEVYKIPNNSGLSSFSGDPSRVCKCDEHHRPQCHNSSYIYITHDIYPGDTFTIPVVVVGGDWGTTPGTVYASFMQSHYGSSILKPPSQHSQWINSTKCSDVAYTVYGSQSVQLVLSAHSFSSYIYYEVCGPIPNKNFLISCTYFTPLYISLYFLPCPPGLSLQGDPPGCDCYPVFTDNGVKCHMNNGITRFSWNTTFWISVRTDETAYSKYCPFDYCKDVKSITTIPDDQCAFNRAGRLCGGCKANYSLAIGSSHCIYCSNNNLSLLIFFAAAGILLVLIISVLNLTVTQGMINGLIFYANIVWMYQSILFPREVSNELVFFKTFIAWLNLDFGIETCFFNGLNAFRKTWLQFVFPLYIWSIAGFMILAARHSTRLTALFGNRAVPILATLILLSYTKLLRIAVTALDISMLNVVSEQNNMSVILLWSVDGTLDYFGYLHVLLIVAALFTLIILWLPYTTLLIFMQWIRRISQCFLLRWTSRLNPFYDAYFAPLKPKHQYWFGVLLLARGTLLLLFASNFTIPQDTNLLILLVLTGFLMFYMFSMSVYKSHFVLVFQSSFFFNLILLSGFMTFAHKIKLTMKEAVVGLSIGTAFLQFCCVILYRIYLVWCSSANDRDGVKGGVNEEQAHAILDISTQVKDPKYSTEALNQPLLLPNHQSNRDTPTY